jgi:glycosyltransferase involved in cell wall biosynthesis
LRILQISHAFPPTFGGVETHLWDITNSLTKRGHEISCLVGGPHESNSYVVEAYGAIAVSRTPEISVEYLLDSRKGINANEHSRELTSTLRSLVASAIAQTDPEIVHIHNAHHFAPELAAATIECAKGRSVINSVHDRVGEDLFPEVLNYTWDRVIYASNYLARELPTDRSSSTLHLGVDLKAFTEEGPKDARVAAHEHPIIFHPARLLRWKGVLTGVEAFASLRKQLGKGSLVLCDSFNTVDNQSELSLFREEVEQAAEMAGIRSSVHFLTFRRNEMPAAYRACDLVWYPTIDEEPLGLVPLEAMACARPIIVSASGGMVETVDHNRTGLIVPKKDAAALASAAFLLLCESEHALLQRSQLVSNARQESLRFSGEIYVDALERIYQGTNS